MKSHHFTHLMNAAFQHPDRLDTLPKLLHIAQHTNLTFNQKRQIVMHLSIYYKAFNLESIYRLTFTSLEITALYDIAKIADTWETVWIDVLQNTSNQYAGFNPILKTVSQLCG